MNPHIRRRRLLKITAALMLAGVVGCGGNKQSRYGKLSTGSKVLALGDSLTAGYGAAAGSDYPAQLAQLSGWQVINGGISGDTSAQALARLPALMRQQPELVLVSIGGNDFLRRVPESETRAHIRRIVQAVQQADVPLVLVGVPYFTAGALFGSLSEHPLYDELAKESDVPLLKDAWADILGDKALKSDQIHANARGYRVFAERCMHFCRSRGLPDFAGFKAV